MKKDPDLKDKEQALIDAALRELAARKSPSASPRQRPPASPAKPLERRAAASQRPAPQARQPAPENSTSPIDHPTVDGWNHPSARDAAPKVKLAVEEKWARVAAAMEMEQRESRKALERTRSLGRRLAIGATIVILLVVIIALR